MLFCVMFCLQAGLHNFKGLVACLLPRVIDRFGKQIFRLRATTGTLLHFLIRNSRDPIHEGLGGRDRKSHKSQFRGENKNKAN